MITRQAFLNTAVDYLVRHQRKSGKFVYRTRPDGGKVKADYNTLRHAGTIYALCQADAHVSKDLTPTIQRALTYLWRWYLVPVPGDEMQFAIASARPGKRNDDIAKIGGLGLSLVALCSVQREWTDFEITAAEGLVRYTQSLVHKDGSMTFKLNYRTGAVDDFVSLYYPGEVALGLLLFGVRTKNDEAIQTCIRILMYLADTRRNQEDVPPDHWALLATSRLFRCVDEGTVDLDEETRVFLYFHGIQVTEKILRIASEARDMRGCLVDNGQCCSIATRLEGLSAMQPWLTQEDYPEIETVNRLLAEGTDYLIESQYRKGDCAGGVPWVPKHHPDAKSREISPEVRIDTVQHAISAVLGAQSVLPAR